MNPPLNDSRHCRIVGLLERLAPHEGYTLSALPGLKFMRANGSIARTPVMGAGTELTVSNARGEVLGQTALPRPAG